jgi:hypothetical protein
MNVENKMYPFVATVKQNLNLKIIYLSKIIYLYLIENALVKNHKVNQKKVLGDEVMD